MKFINNIKELFSDGNLLKIQALFILQDFVIGKELMVSGLQ